MKRLIAIPAVLVCFILSLSNPITAQKKPVYELIGKKVKNVVSAYGKPKHHDKSNPAMESVFYKTKTSRMAFIGNEDGVYQAESCTSLTSKKSAQRLFDNIIADGIDKGFEADTLTVEKINLTKPGATVDVSYFHNTVNKKYEISVKAKRTAN